ncbi:MAG: tRNA (N6-isopentenyl adenosine(37)-C2)-methylthiotransferase MiaB [SAR324 cluster bacterium]|nr:tRNA (N6-isopentenyl adenosine(37)-C2)-methylthiotransferase MiaB [SAR324 cluster bacterium]
MTEPTTRQRESGSAHKRVFIQTFGCQMNEYDTAKMLELLGRERYTRVDRPEGADLILINTCAIREKPEHKVYSLLGRLEGLKRRHPETVIGVAGCVAQQDGEKILKRARNVDFVFGTDNLFDLPEMLARVAEGERFARTQWRPPKAPVENFIPPEAIPGLTPGSADAAAPAPVKAQLAIAKGCNNMCTFCVVPYTRGREVSREPDNILQEAAALVARGAKEIMLLGQNVNSYRAQGVDFVELLHRLNGLPGLERIRYTSPHPKDFNEPLARAHRDLPKLCEHLHLPFQSGSDRILRAMRRNHTIAEYLEKLAVARELVPGLALSTDIIVGFPGETEADFEATLNVIRNVRFDHLYAFKFSPRSITPAAELPGQVPEAVKAERLSRILALHQANAQAANDDMIGSRQEILVEGAHPRDPNSRMGRTRGHKSTKIPGCAAEPGALVTVEIVAARKFSLVGKVQGDG